MDRINFRITLAKRISNDLLGLSTAEEKEELQAWINESPENKQEYEALIKQIRTEVLRDLPIDIHQEWDLFASKNINRKKTFSLKKWMYVAASISVLSMGTLYYFQRNNAHENRQSQHIQKDILKSQQGILLLANGETKDLGNSSSFNEEPLSLEELTKLDSNTTAVALNTLIIPKGAEFKVKLPDGTIVSLNAESSLSFPNIFTGKSREVQLEGEATFDVKHKENNPFVVHLKEQNITVLGTLFNVEAYKNQPTITTLVRGKIAVNTGNKKVILNPNEQFIVNLDGSTIKSQVNAAESIQWTQGIFEFSNTDLEQIMEKLARWYDIDYDFINAGARSARFTISVSREESLKSLLNKIEKTGRVHFRITDKKVKIFD